jgi:hypothetical protein
MANAFANIMPRLLARALKGLRERVNMPRLVNSDYSDEAAQKGTTIDIPVPTAVGVQDVVPSNTPIAPVDTTPGLVQVQLNNWKQNTPFYLTDKDLVEIDRNRHFLPMQAAEAVRSLARAINQSIFSEYKSVFGFFGTPGTTPFATNVQGATQVKKILNQQLCPKDDRRVVLDFNAEAQFLELNAFNDVSQTGENDVKIYGEMGKKFGMDWYSDDDVPTHTAGTITAALTTQTGATTNAGTLAVPVATGAGAACALVVGDIVTFANHTQTYVVTTALTLGASATGTLNVYPALKVAVPASNAITVKASHVVNLAFHRDAFAFAMRPLADATSGLPSPNILTMQDPQTGLVMRLEIVRQHKQTVWEFDVLWGVKLVRPELACRLAG